MKLDMARGEMLHGDTYLPSMTSSRQALAMRTSAPFHRSFAPTRSFSKRRTIKTNGPGLASPSFNRSVSISCSSFSSLAASADCQYRPSNRPGTFRSRYRDERPEATFWNSRLSPARYSLSSSANRSPSFPGRMTHYRRIFSIALPFASSSISLSKQRILCISGSSISSRRTPHTTPLISELFG